MRHISIPKSAVSVATVFAAWHAIWVTMVAAGWAAGVLNFFLELHFLEIDYQLAPYSAFTAFSLIAITFCVGGLLGAIFAFVWDWLTFADAPERTRRKRAAARTN